MADNDFQQTNEDLIVKYERFIWKTINKRAADIAGNSHELTLAEDEKNDIFNDVVIELLKLSTAKRAEHSLVMFAVECAVEDGIDHLRGKLMRCGKRKADFFSYIEEHNPESTEDGKQDKLRTVIAEKIAIRPNAEQALALKAVRARLSGRALKVFDWIVNEREHIAARSYRKKLLNYCQSRWHVSEKMAEKYRQQIADAMIAEGLKSNE